MNKAQEVKVVLLGEAAVGKSSLILRFVTNKFSDAYSVTIGGAFLTKMIVHNGVSTNFKIWDTAGSERYRSIAAKYYKEAQVALLVYDVTKRDSLEKLSYWIEELQTIGPQDIIMVVVGNKTDLIEQEQVSIEQGNRFAKDNGALFKLTSAKQGKGVEDMFEFIAAEISKRNLGTLTVQDGMKLSSTKNLKKEKEKGGCC